MKVCIIYFSGTGNTKLAALAIGDNLRQLGYKTENRNIESADFAKDLEEFDVLGFGFPVYAWRAPEFYKNRLLEKLPNIDNMPAFVFNTRAIASWWANHYLAKVLRKKKYYVFEAANFTAPPNDWMVLFKQTNFLVKRFVKFGDFFMWKIEKFSNKLNYKIQNKQFGQKRLVKNPLGYIASNVGNFFGKLLFSAIAKKWKYDSELCLKCKKCMELCPTNNISFGETKKGYGPIWDDKCVYCFRCINYCPLDAILLTDLSKGKYRYRLDI